MLCALAVCLGKLHKQLTELLAETKLIFEFTVFSQKLFFPIGDLGGGGTVENADPLMIRQTSRMSVLGLPGFLKLHICQPPK